MSSNWLTKLNNRQLHRLAVYIGTPCSGTKPCRLRQVEHAIQGALQLDDGQNRSGTGRAARSQPLSIVSIDVGIRNLAYCHLSTYLSTINVENEPVNIDAWTRMSIEEHDAAKTDEIEKISRAGPPPALSTIRADKESYEPAVYAMRAYSFIKRIIESHQPTHVLIERQRFRSAGSAAIQEWTIRVGVFEAMLYAALHTLKAEKHYHCHVIPMSPKQVNRYWLESDWEELSEQPRTRKTASAAKLEKIKCVGQIMDSSKSTADLIFSAEAIATKLAFLSRHERRKSGSGTKPKLDDLSDSFLQGLGWIHWQMNRLRLSALGSSALPLGT